MNEDHLLRLFAVFAEHGQVDNLLVQRYMSDGQDWVVHAYVGHGSSRLVFTGVKLRSYPDGAGLTAASRLAALRKAAASSRAVAKRAVGSFDSACCSTAS